MTRRRPPEFDLASALARRGFTPRAADAPGLLRLLGEEDTVARAAERALIALGDAGAQSTIDALTGATDKLRPRLARILGRLAATGTEPERIRHDLLALFADSDERTRRQAASALGKLGGPGVEDALLGRFLSASPAEARVLAEALGKVGGLRSRAHLARWDSADPELRRVVSRALLMLDRTAGREVASAIDDTQPAPRPTPVTVRCRVGLEGITSDELRELDARVHGPGLVQATLTGPMARLWRSRTLLSFGFPLPETRGSDLALAVTSALTSDAAWTIFSTWTIGPLRYRIEWAHGGHRRSVVWQIAQLVHERRPELVNDPTRTSWMARVSVNLGTVHVDLEPRLVHDPRFTWRRRDVPASSHPTIAAALARIAGVRADDVVWDPFVGSGAELIERARLGPYRALIGSDRDRRALDAAQANLTAASSKRALLCLGEATEFWPRGVSLILTNPPMGLRSRRGTARDLLDRFARHAGRVLVPGGRLVWISPFPDRSVAHLSRAGCALVFAQALDMGGFPATLQVFKRKAEHG